MGVLEFDRVSVGYRDREVLEEITFSVPSGSCCVSIIGPNGAGKSTLIKTALGLIRPHSGGVRILGKSPDRLDRRKTPIGYVPQTRAINNNFPITVKEIVMMGRSGRLGVGRRAGKHDWKAVDLALERVDALNLSDRLANELSGGERQRVFIARALAQEASLLFLDEPAAGLDIPAKRGIYEYIEKLHGQGISTVTATHDIGSVEMHNFKTVLCLNKRVVAFGEADEVLVEGALLETFNGAYFHTEGGGEHVHL